MSTKSMTVAIAAALIVLSSAVTQTFARDIVGSTSIASFGTPPEETVKRVRPAAAASLRSEIHLWLKSEMRIDLDTVNTVKMFALDRLVERCVQSAEERHASRGRVWTLSLVLNPSDLRKAIEEHNAFYEKIAVNQWDRHRLVLENDTATGFAAAITALAAATARITTQEQAQRLGPMQYADIRARVQVLVDRMEVKANVAVIEGRPGSLPNKFPVATVTIAGTPIENFPFTVFAQNGRQLGQMSTDANGELPLKNLRVPFVHNSSMMTVSPDARNYLRTNKFIRFRDLGLRLTKGQELTFIYKVPTLTYSLDYKVSAKDADINIPQDFRAEAHIHKFLKDSCNLQAAQTASSADMNIRINVEFSKATLDATEEDALIMNASANFSGAGINLSDKTTFERRYSFGTSQQMGEYIWEATRTLRSLIRGTLNKVDGDVRN